MCFLHYILMLCFFAASISSEPACRWVDVDQRAKKTSIGKHIRVKAQLRYYKALHQSKFQKVQAYTL